MSGEKDPARNRPSKRPRNRPSNPARINPAEQPAEQPAEGRPFERPYERVETSFGGLGQRSPNSSNQRLRPQGCGRARPPARAKSRNRARGRTRHARDLAGPRRSAPQRLRRRERRALVDLRRTYPLS